MGSIDAIIDGFSHSVIDSRTGRSKATVIRHWGGLLAGEFAKTASWEFNWYSESSQPDREVYGLTLRRSTTLEGLLSLAHAGDHVFLHLLESAPHNRGEEKLLIAVPGNLVAFACLLAFKAGFCGHVAFDSKTALIKHYEQTLGAKQIGRSARMVIDEQAATALVDRCYGKADQWPI